MKSETGLQNNCDSSNQVLQLDGFSAGLAIWKLLQCRGIRSDQRSLDEGNDCHFIYEELPNKLCACGLEARLVHASLGDLTYHQLPTLAATCANKWILLRERTARKWYVEAADGVKTISQDNLEKMLSGIVIEIDNAFPDTGGFWQRFLKLLPEHRKVLFISFVASAIAQGLALAFPWFTTIIIDNALTNNASSLLNIICVGIIITSFFRAWIGWLRDTALNYFSTRIDMVLAKGLFDHLLHLPFSYLQSKTLGELLQAFSGINRARTLVLNRGIGILFDSIMSVVCIAYMMMLIPTIAMMIFLGAVIISFISIVIGYLQARKTWAQIRASQAEHSALAELLKGVPTLKAMGSQEWVLRRWKNRLSTELSHTLKLERISLWGDAINELFSQGSIICLLVWGGLKVLGGETSLGQLLAFSQLSSSFTSSFINLSQSMISVALAKPQMSGAHEAFKTARQPSVSLSSTAKLLGPIVAEGVWFRYEKTGRWILEDIHLRVEPGSFHQIKGVSGSGKSTLLKLLAGLYFPETGRISVGGVEGQAANTLMTYLPQFPQFFNGSILENLRIFSGDRPKAHLFAAAKETGLDDWVKSLPMGYQTMVASDGRNFSGGQRQLIAITAVLASNKQLLLLDEAFSNLDWISRKRIVSSSYFKGRTIIYASHEEVILENSG